MALTPPPTAPVSTDPDTFDPRADALVAWHTTNVSEMTAFQAALTIIAAGTADAIPFTFSTATNDADHGNGVLCLDNATQNAATTIRTDLLGSDTVDYTAILATFTNSTSTVKGRITLVKLADATKWLSFDVSALASPSGYKNITVSNVGSSTANPFANNDPIMLKFTRNGDIGATGPAGTPGGIDWEWGDGSDGNVTVSGAVTLARDMFYNNLTLSAGAAINTTGYRIFVAGTLDISAAPAGAIFRNGTIGNAGATGASGGAGGGAVTGLSANNLGGCQNSGAGGSAVSGDNGGNGTAASSAGGWNGGGATNAAGAGGNSSLGSGGTGATTPAGAYNGTMWPSLPAGLLFVGSTFTILKGSGSGSGGGAGGSSSATLDGGGGGSGGTGAGVVFVAAKTISRGTNVTAGIIQSKGGTGGVGGVGKSTLGAGGGGGSGGGGGWVIIVFAVRSGSTITGAIDVSGGTGGAGGNGNTTGHGGNGGAAGDSGRLSLFDMTAGTLTTTVPVAGAAGSTTSTTTGASGGTNTKQVDL